MIQKVRKKKGRVPKANGRPKTNDPRVNLTFSVFSSVIGVVKASELDPESYRKIKIVAENAIVQAIEDGTVKIDVHSGKEAE